MKQKEMKVICACCGKEVTVPVRISSYRRDSGLDQKPEIPALLPLIQECPNCHYCSNALEAPVSENVKTKILNENYYNYMEEVEISDRAFVRLQAAMRGTEDDKKNAFFHLWSAWFCEWNDSMETAKMFRRKAVDFMEKCLQQAVDFPFMLIYIDCLRQLEAFEKAEEVIADIEGMVVKNLSPERAEYKVFLYEKQLVEAKDARAHMVSEAM